MKFTMVTKDNFGKRFTDVEDRPELTTKEQVEDWCREQVGRYNTYYKPHKRQLVNVWYSEPKETPKIVEKEIVNSNEHQWERISSEPLVTPKGRQYHIIGCKRCGISGRQYLDTMEIKRDNAYTKKMYENCDWKKQ